ncbi:tRNA (guanine-N(7)-)-methyltransferase [subsurface metagenome]
MSKGKLEKFSEMHTFPNVIQPSFREVFQKDFRLKDKWNRVFFNKDYPITLELGCGKGEYSVELARMFPDRNFLGIDIKGARLWKGAKAALQDNIQNVGFIRTRIDFIDSFFAENEVNEIWLTFPDPQLKKPRKRLTSSRFLNMYKKFLKTDGCIHLKTDDPELYAYTLSVARQNNLKVEFATDNLYALNFSDQVLSIKTYYEKIWIETGFNIHYMRFKLSGNHVIEEPAESGA